MVTDNGLPPLSVTNSFEVIVTEVNSAPVLGAQTNRTVAELTLLTVTNAASDADLPANTLSYQLISPPAGAVIDTNGVITWTPTEAQGPGTNTIRTVVTDNGLPPLSITNSFEVIVMEVNSAPVLGAQTNRTVAELTLLTVTNAASDADLPANTLSYQLISPPAGAVIDTNGVITWTPTEAQGPSTNRLTTVVSDGSLSATNSFTVTVTEVNTAPVVSSLSVTTSEDSGTNLVLTASDPDIPSNSLAFVILSSPTNGLLSGFNPNSGAVTYTPNLNYNGLDSFLFTVSDGSLLATGQVSIIVTPVNDPPVAQADAYSMGIGTTLAVAVPGILANDTNIDGPNPLSAELVSGPVHGLLSLNPNGAFTYRPTNYYIGTDSFSYRASDGLTNSGLATVSIAVSYELRILSISLSSGVATVTWASISNQVYRLQYRNSLSETNWTDVSPDVLATGPITSTTNALGTGPQRFYRIVLVALQGIHNGPALPSQINRSVNELSSLIVTNTAIDNDIPLLPLTYTLAVTNLLDNSLVLNASIDGNGVITWTPTEAQGPSTNRLTTVVSDGSLSATNSFTVTVTEVNTAPVVSSLSVTTSEDSGTNLVLTASDPDIPSNSLAFVILSSPTNGLLSGFNPNSGAVTYTPNLNYNGLDSFLFTVSDGSLLATGQVSIIVTPVNDPPVAQADAYSMGIGTTLAVAVPGILANDTNIDGPNPLSAELVSGPVHGLLSLNPNGAFTYRPTNYYIGTDSFSYRASDGLTNSGLATVSIAVSYELRILSISLSSGVATVTWASISNQVYRLQYRNSLSETNWTDVSPDVLATGPITSTTNALGTGPQRFYRIVLVALQGIHNGPALPSQINRSVNELSSLIVTNTAIDNDIPLLPLTYTLAVTNLLDNSLVLNASIDGNGVITWTPTEAQGPSTNRLTTVVSDGSLSATNSFTVTVTEVNTAPALTAQSDRTIAPLHTLAVSNAAADSDVPANALSYQLINAPAGAVIDASGVITWTPTEAQASSTYTITTVVTDNGVPPLIATNRFGVTVTEREFRITSFIIINGVAVITWNSVPGQTYQLCYSDNLSGGTWINVLPTVTATGLTTSSTNALGTSPQRFYRVQLVPPVTAPLIQSINVSGGVASVVWTAVAGHSYRLHVQRQPERSDME